MPSLSPLDPLVPFALDIGKKDLAPLIDALRGIRKRSGIHRFVLSTPGRTCRIKGCDSPEHIEKLAHQLRQVIDILEPEGFEIGLMYTVTIKIGENPFTHIRGINGQESSACPLDPEFRKYMLGNYETMARIAKPKLLMLEDDYQLSNHPGVYENGSWGCFCDRHLKMFEPYAGSCYSLEALQEIFKQDTDEALRLRLLHAKMSADTMIDFSKGIEQRVHAVSPATRIGFCECGTQDRDGCPTDRIALALAGHTKHRPFVRYKGAFYGPDVPLSMPGRLFHYLFINQHHPDDIEIYMELDTCPHETFFGSACRMETFMSYGMLYGCESMLYSACPPEADSAEVEPAYIDMFRDNRERFIKMREIGQRTEIIGPTLMHLPSSVISLPYQSPNSQFAVEQSWCHLLGRMGIPFTTTGGKTNLITGFEQMRQMSAGEIRAMLSGSVSIDGEAAEYLDRRGFGELTGVTVEAHRTKSDFYKEIVQDVDGLHDLAGIVMDSTMYAPYGLDGSGFARIQAAPGAEAVTYLVYPDENRTPVQAGVIRFKNKLGGRVVTHAPYFKGARSINTFSRNKRAVILRMFEWMGEELPAFVLIKKNVLLHVAKEKDGSALYLMATNLLADEYPQIEFQVCSAFAGKRVDLMIGSEWKEADGGWDGQKLAVRTPFKIQKPVFLRISK